MKQIKLRFLLLLFLFLTAVIWQQMNPVFWSKLRILLPSSNHEGKSCYLRLIRVQRGAQGAQQIKVNSVGLKGRNNSITNCFLQTAVFCFSPA